MKLKLGASIEGCTDKAFRIALAADKVWQSHGFSDATISAGTDGKHKVGSKHYDDPTTPEPEGNALDLRTWYLTKEAKEQFAAELRAELGPDYDVVVEDDHIHAEYDPKGIR